MVCWTTRVFIVYILVKIDNFAITVLMMQLLGMSPRSANTIGVPHPFFL